MTLSKRSNPNVLYLNFCHVYSLEGYKHNPSEGFMEMPQRSEQSFTMLKS